MFEFKISSLLIVVLLALGITTIACAAGEKHKWYLVSFTTKANQLEVGDEEGHVLLLVESKRLINDVATGEKTIGTATTLIDMNLKTGQGNLHGYQVETFSNGDKRMVVTEGKLIGNHGHGTWRFTKGTGKREGVKGSGTWDSYSMGPGQPSYNEVQGEEELAGH